MSVYTVHSMFLTMQGEGANIGRVAVFIRFAGCNLWSGIEAHRKQSICQFCDTEFVGGKRYTSAEALAAAAAALWPGKHRKMCVLTGGEPLLQVDAELIDALRAQWFYIAVETNGTQDLRKNVDWLCVSPKAGTKLVLKDADELKLVFPQPGAEPELFEDFPAVHKWLSPMTFGINGKRTRKNMIRAAEFCRRHPEWRLAIQAHKVWQIP